MIARHHRHDTSSSFKLHHSSYLDHVPIGQHKVLVLAASILLLLCWKQGQIAGLLLDNADNLLLSGGMEVVSGLAEKQLQMFRDIPM